jgi:hypothetical protein
MSHPDTCFASPGQIRRAARTLNRAADAAAGGPVDIEELRQELRRIGLGPKSDRASGARPADPPKQSYDDDAPDPKPVVLPLPRGPPEPIWVRPKVGAQIAGVGLTLFYRWLSTGRVVSKRVGGVRLVYVPSIHAIAADPVPTCRPGPHAHRKAIREEE